MTDQARYLLINELASTVTKEVIDGLKELTRCCVTCEHFNEANENCKLVGKRPPAKVIAWGCEKYYPRVPF